MPIARAIADHLELMAEGRRQPVIVWCGAMRDLSCITREDAKYSSPDCSR